MYCVESFKALSVYKSTVPKLSKKLKNYNPKNLKCICFLRQYSDADPTVTICLAYRFCIHCYSSNEADHSPLFNTKTENV
jgi:hypothetical protein